MLVERDDQCTAALLPEVGVRELDEVCVLEVASEESRSSRSGLESVQAVHSRRHYRISPGGA